MQSEEGKKRISRRVFLRGAGMGAGAAGAAAVAVATGAPVRADSAEGGNRRIAGYRETEHVRRVYELSRF